MVTKVTDGKTQTIVQKGQKAKKGPKRQGKSQSAWRDPHLSERRREGEEDAVRCERRDDGDGEQDERRDDVDAIGSREQHEGDAADDVGDADVAHALVRFLHPRRDPSALAVSVLCAARACLWCRTVCRWTGCARAHAVA